MKKSLIALGLLALSAPLLAANRVQLESPVTYAPDAGVVETVKRECRVEDMLEVRVGKALDGVNKGGDSTISATTQPADDVSVLRLRITRVLGVGGGAWSGPKAITVAAELIDKGKVVRQTKLNRGTSGGAFGGFKGTCAILERSAAALGKDLARWVRDPSYKVTEEAAPAAEAASEASAP
jgi:hypothetical protein